MERAIIKLEDGQHVFCDDPEWGVDCSVEETVGVVDIDKEIGCHECKRSVLYDDMTGYIDEIQEENELPDNESFIVTYFKDDGSHGSGLEQLVDFGITKQQIINNVIAQKYVEGADYFTMGQLQPLTERKFLKPVIDQHLNDALEEYHKMLERKNGCKYSGDITPEQSLEWDKLVDDIADLFERLAEQNKEDCRMRNYEVVIIGQNELQKRFGEKLIFTENGFLDSSIRTKTDFYGELEKLLNRPIVSIRPSGRPEWDEVLVLLAKGYIREDGVSVLDYDNAEDIKTVLLDILQDNETDEYEVFDCYAGTCSDEVWREVNAWVHEIW